MHAKHSRSLHPLSTRASEPHKTFGTMFVFWDPSNSKVVSYLLRLPATFKPKSPCGWFFLRVPYRTIQYHCFLLVVFKENQKHNRSHFGGAKLKKDTHVDPEMVAQQKKALSASCKKRQEVGTNEFQVLHSSWFP